MDSMIYRAFSLISYQVVKAWQPVKIFIFLYTVVFIASLKAEVFNLRDEICNAYRNVFSYLVCK